MCLLLEVHTLGPTSTKYMPWAMRFTCQAVAVTGVLAYDVGGRCAHFQRGTAKTGSFGAKIKIHRNKLTQNTRLRSAVACDDGGAAGSPGTDLRHLRRSAAARPAARLSVQPDIWGRHGAADAASGGRLSTGSQARAVPRSASPSAPAVKVLYVVPATLNSTQQPFGASWGERPNAAGGCFNPWCKPLSTWKALLKPTAPGGSYTITATCAGCTGKASAALTRNTFGDVWHCSGQSNMWLPVQKTYSRNDTVAAIRKGKYTNIHLMGGNSGSAPQGAAMGKPSGKGGGTWPPPYGAKGGSNPWMTAAQAIADGTSSGLTGGNMSLFKMGATCWYFAQRLAELGVDHPIGLINTAIGGQRIEE